jgi:hypothetical protein
MKVLSVLLLCVLAACNSPAPPLPPPAASTIPDLTVFLVQGTPEQKSVDQVAYRKHDYPPPNGYQVDDSVLLHRWSHSANVFIPTFWASELREG